MRGLAVLEGGITGKVDSLRSGREQLNYKEDDFSETEV
jgi:hypothetical protein